MISALRHYDEAVKDYFDFIKVSNGIETYSPQIQIAIPSRSGVKVNLDNQNNTPLLPVLVISRRNLSPLTESKIMYSRITRPYKIWRNDASKKYEGIEFMAYSASYQVDIISDNMEMYNQLVEKMIFKLHAKRYVRTKIDIRGQNFSSNCPITDVTVSDNINYVSIPDTENRLINGNVNFNLAITLYSTDYGINSVDKVGQIVETDEGITIEHVVTDTIIE